MQYDNTFVQINPRFKQQYPNGYYPPELFVPSGQAARQTAQERFDVRAMSRAYAALYQQLLHARATKRNARVSL